ALPAQEQRFEAFFDLLLDLLARLVRARAGGASDAPESVLAGKLIAEDRVPAWAAAWEEIVRERADAELLNLDKKALVLATFARLEALARR
ncbi:MAG: AAA family ATPase, partial [Hyphomicrobiaceae bacterium]